MSVLSSLKILNDENAPKAIDSNALNVTRVGGLAATIAAVGAAAAALFAVESSDPLALRIASLAATGVVVAASLITIAIIIASDVRARATAECCKTPETSKEGGAPSTEDQQKTYVEAVRSALDEAETVSGEMSRLPELDRLRALGALYSGLAKRMEGLVPPSKLAVRHSAFVVEAEALADEAKAGAKEETLSERAAVAKRLDEHVRQLRTSIREGLEHV